MQVPGGVEAGEGGAADLPATSATRGSPRSTGTSGATCGTSASACAITDTDTGTDTGPSPSRSIGAGATCGAGAGATCGTRAGGTCGTRAAAASTIAASRLTGAGADEWAAAATAAGAGAAARAATSIVRPTPLRRQKSWAGREIVAQEAGSARESTRGEWRGWGLRGKQVMCNGTACGAMKIRRVCGAVVEVEGCCMSRWMRVPYDGVLPGCLWFAWRAELREPLSQESCRASDLDGSRV